MVLDEEAWPDPVCMCADGAELNAHNQCAGPLDGKLFDEVSKVNPPPVLSSVIALLDDGANPNIINDDGVHILAVAATLLHAEVISVLVSAGRGRGGVFAESPAGAKSDSQPTGRRAFRCGGGEAGGGSHAAFRRCGGF